MGSGFKDAWVRADLVDVDVVCSTDILGRVDAGNLGLNRPV